jgi:adenylosuccinate synthase
MTAASADPLALVVTDLGFGDGGKGTIADLLCHRLGIETVYRHSGGPNSVHHVVTESGEHAASCFASHLSPATHTQLGPDFVIKPASLLREARVIEKRLGGSALDRLSIDPSAKILLPHHAIVGQMREVASGGARRGSTGLGVGEAVLDAASHPLLSLTAADCRVGVDLQRRIARIAEHKIAQAEDIVARLPCRALRGFVEALKAGPFSADDVSALATMFRDVVTIEDSRCYLERAFGQGRNVLCEGAHGTLIDRDHGFAPHVTRRSTTAGPTRAFLEALETRSRIVTIGIVRAVAFRHGPGPFVTEEDAAFRHLVEAHNRENSWQGRPRYGWFDSVATRYALACNDNPEIIAVTMLDLLLSLRELHVATGYALPIRLAEQASELLDTNPLDWGLLRVHAIRPTDSPGRACLARLLDQCRPILIPLAKRGAETSDGNVLSDSLLRTFLEYLALPEALGRPADILSFGPGRAQKSMSADLWRRLRAPC